MPALNNIILPVLYAIRALPDIAENAIGGLLVAFTSPAQRDKFDQYFTRDTDFGLELLGDTAQRPLNYHHNHAEITGAIGFVRSIEVRDEGLYAVSVLDNNHPSYPFIRSQVDSGELGYSAETLPNWMAVEQDGRVSRFPVFGAAVTRRPSAPEGMTTVGALRALGVDDIDAGFSDAPDEGIVPTSLRSVWYLPLPETVNDPAPPPNRRIIPFNQLPPPPSPARQLPDASLRGEVPLGGSSKITVTSPLDEISALDLLGWHCLGNEALAGTRRTLEYPVPYEQYMRGMMHKVAKFYDDDAKARRSFLTPADDILTPKGDLMHLRGDWEKFSENHLTAKGKGWEGRDFKSANHFLRADELMGSDVASGGDEWVYTAWGDMVWWDIRQNAAVLGNLQSFNMDSNPFLHPTMPKTTYGRLVREADDRSQMTIAASPYPDRKVDTDNVTFTIVGVIGDGILYTGWLRKWSQINVLAELQRNMIDTITRTVDRDLIWGDKVNDDTNNFGWLGSGGALTGTAADHHLSMNGMVYYALGNAASYLAGAGAAITSAKFIAQRAKMGALGTQVQHLIDILPHGIYFDMLGINDYQTLDTYGAGAVNLVGELGRFQGIPLIMSEEFGLGNSAGKYPYDGSGTVKGNIIHDVRTSKVGKGVKGINITVEKAPGNDAFYMYGGLEVDWQMFQRQGICYQYNLA